MKISNDAPSIAAVYRITNTINGKIYIGETADYRKRLIAYERTAKYPTHGYPVSMDMNKYGIENFKFEILTSEDDDPNLIDPVYRRAIETTNIVRNGSLDPDIGYNRRETNGGNKRKPTREHDKYFRRQKAILVYDRHDNSVELFMGVKSCNDAYGYKDSGIVTNAVRNGTTVDGKNFYKFNFTERLDNAIRIMRNKLRPTVWKDQVVDDSELKKNSFDNYIEGLLAVNEWCLEFDVNMFDVEYALKLAKGDDD